MYGSLRPNGAAETAALLAKSTEEDSAVESDQEDYRPRPGAQAKTSASASVSYKKSVLLKVVCVLVVFLLLQFAITGNLIPSMPSWTSSSKSAASAAATVAAATKTSPVHLEHNIVAPKPQTKASVVSKIKTAEEETVTESVAETTQPHILWIVADDLGYSDIASNGAEFPTPNLDFLATNGIKLSSHYAQPMCSPARSAFLTGRYPFRMGAQGVTMDPFKQGASAGVPTKYKTLANYLSDAGYDNRAYGKWHLGYAAKSMTPTERGFDHFMGFHNFAVHYTTKRTPDSTTTDYYDWWTDDEVDWDDSDDDLYTSWILRDKIISDINDYGSSDDSTDPLFMYVALQNPHWFVEEVPDSFVGTDCDTIVDSDRSSYCKHVQVLDTAIGDILTALKDNDMYDNTLIALSTDNGALSLDLCGNPGGHSAAGSMYPFRGGKYTLFEGGVRTPAYISGALIDDTLQGTTSDTIVHAVDWLPTLLHFTRLGGDYAADDTIDGLDRFGLLFEDDDDDTRDLVPLNLDYSDGFISNTAVLYGDYKLIINTDLTVAGSSCDVRSMKPGSDDFAGVVNDDAVKMSGSNLFLFNIADDPYEYTDLLESVGRESDNYSTYESMIEEIYSRLSTIREAGFVASQSSTQCNEGLSIGASNDAWMWWADTEDELTCTTDTTTVTDTDSDTDSDTDTDTDTDVDTDADTDSDTDTSDVVSDTDTTQ